MFNTIFSRNRLMSPGAVIVYLSLFKLLLHLFTNGQFGYHRDELYYIACGEHLDFGYVDHPPLIAFVARFWNQLFGDSLFSIRFLPAVAGAATVFITGVMTRQLGGKGFAVIIACLSVIIAPIFLSTNNLFTTNVFDQLFWAISISLIIKIIKTENPKYFLAAAAVIGLALLNKHSAVFLIAGLAAGMILTSSRRYFLNKFLWLGAGITLLIFSPNIVWQIYHGWPTLEFLKGAEINRPTGGALPSFIKQIITSFHPLTFPIWAAGIYFLLFSKEGRKYRLLGWMFIALVVIFSVQRSKDYYIAPAFPVLWASGAVMLEMVIQRVKLEWLRPVIAGILLISGAALAPLSIPLLPLDKTVKYCEYMQGGLHPVYSDMLGWESMVKTVAGVYDGLPQNERRLCAIMTQNYGQAAAMDFFGPRYGLPKVISPHNSYWMWGSRGYSGEVLLTMGISFEGLRQGFEHAELAGVVKNENVMWYETDQPIIIWRKPRISLKDMWPMIKVYY